MRRLATTDELIKGITVSRIGDRLLQTDLDIQHSRAPGIKRCKAAGDGGLNFGGLAQQFTVGAEGLAHLFEATGSTLQPRVAMFCLLQPPSRSRS